MQAMQSHCRETGLFNRELGGDFEIVKRLWGEDARWEMWSVVAPLADVRAALQGEERLHLAIIHGEADCVIGGDAEACARAIVKLGRQRCSQLDYSLCVHVPELDQHRDAWLEAHRRETFEVPGVRFYSGGIDGAYSPEKERCAEAILAQANRCLDFPRMVEQAWADGVRIFLEHGPGGACARWIRDVLGVERARQAVIVSLDRRGRGVSQVLECMAALLAAGVAVDPDPLLTLSLIHI